MSRRAFNPFTCPNCNALYQVVKVEAGLKTDDRERWLEACGGALAGREGTALLDLARHLGLSLRCWN